jgi:hypothetical protein
MTSPAMMIPLMLGGAPPSPTLIYDSEREREDEYSALQNSDDELSARIEELSGFPVGTDAAQATYAQRRELVFERGKIRIRMLAIAPH